MSERKLSQSYGTLQKYECSNGDIKQWIRWNFSKPKEKWLKKNQLKESWLYENLEWMIQGGQITSIRKAGESNLYYIVTTQNGEEYYLVFEQTKEKDVNSLVLVFEDHWQHYSYNIMLNTLEFDHEVYDCFQNGIEDIWFRHCKNKNSVYVSTIIVGGKINLNFSLNNDVPVWKVLNEYNSILNEISQYNLNSISALDRKSQIEIVVKIANMIRKHMSKEITSFRVIFGCNIEWLDVDSNGVSMKARLCEGGNYVLCHKEGWIERLDPSCIIDAGYRIKDGAIVNWNGEKVTEQKFIKTILSDIRAAKGIFYRVKQEFLAD